jgi:hypothetical protein
MEGIMSIFIPGEAGEGLEFHSVEGFPNAIINAWDGLIYVGGPDFRIRFMNGHFIEMLGRDATGEPCFHVDGSAPLRCDHGDRFQV